MGNLDLIVIINGAETFIITGQEYSSKNEGIEIALTKFKNKFENEKKEMKKINYPVESERTNEEIQLEEILKLERYYDVEKILAFELNN